MVENCIFCKIIKGEIPSQKIYEDKNTLAFLDITPVNKGHTLVIPKKHYENILDIPEETLKQVILTVKKVSIAINKISDGISITQSNRKAGGQVVPHIHFHIIPRLEKDGLKLWPQHRYENDEDQETAKKIKNLL